MFVSRSPRRADPRPGPHTEGGAADLDSILDGVYTEKGGTLKENPTQWELYSTLFFQSTGLLLLLKEPLETLQ